MKILFTALFLFITYTIEAQKNTLSSQFQILKKGFCDESSTKCKKQQITYLHACEIVGNYFYSCKNYDSAFIYYSLPSVLNDHSTIFQSNLAIELRKKVLAKAGDMKLSGIGMTKDTLAAYYFHYQFPLSKQEMINFSLNYFNTIEGIFNFGRYDENKADWQFEINPFMISDTITLNKVVSEILDKSISQNHINLKLIGGYQPSEELDALYYSTLNYIDRQIKKHRKKIEIKLDVDYGGGHMYMSDICIPSLKVSFE